MPQSTEEVVALANWYSERVRPFLAREEPKRLEEFDADLQRLHDIRGSSTRELAACFLGVSGVGKSTLINALVAGHETVVPSGGIGPLTAQALEVRRGEAPSFQARYHGPGQLGKVLFALEQTLKARQKRLIPVPSGTQGRDDEDPGIEADDAKEIKCSVLDGEDPSHVLDGEDSSRRKVDEYIKQARLMVTGSQDGEAELPYLADCLRTALSRPSIWGSQPRLEDEVRLRKIRAVLSLAVSGQPCHRLGAADDVDFRDDLDSHASGYLAPLIKQLEVIWNSTAMPGNLVLVDLPGVGIANDIYRSVTHEWIRGKARAIVLVVDKSGVTESAAQLLQSSGFLNRLLYTFENPAQDPVRLLVAVVKIDDVAQEAWRKERSLKKPGKPKQEYFAEICEKSTETIRGQMRRELEKAWSSDGVGSGQANVIEHLLEKLEIHPLSAVEYRRFLMNDEEDKSFLSGQEQSNIPRLQESLRRLAYERHEAEASRVREARDEFAAKMLKELEAIQARWLEEARIIREVEQLREEFLGFLNPLREEFLRRQGAYRNFLKETIPQIIERMVERAQGKTRSELSAYLRDLSTAHVKTLQAAVRKGGVHYGARHVELPKEFALRFEVPIAEAWGKDILRKIRIETTQYAGACVQLVGEVVEWVKARGDRFPTRPLEARFEAIRTDAKNLESVGKIMTNGFRQQVNRRLVSEIEGPIRKRCKQFVDSAQDVDTGTRERILRLFHDIADGVTKDAGAAAVEILQGCFRDVEREILTVMNRHADPLEAAKEAVIASGVPASGGDEQRKRRVLEEVEVILAGVPHFGRDGAEVGAGAVA